MKKFEGFMAGANLGHWISQYNLYSELSKEEAYKKQNEHFDTYIQESDFERAAKWGLDHFRLPVDYYLFEDDNNPGVYDESRLAYIDFALNMCKKYGLNMLLDLHHAPGFTFNDGYDTEKNSLFTNEKQTQRYINIWKMFATRYKDEGDNLAFELLNELVIPDCSLWNKLWKRTAEEVIKINPNRKIVIGSNNWNAIEHLQYLDIDYRDNFVYNFHCYEPYMFTHQRASWNPNTDAYKRAVVYPFKLKEHEKYIKGCVPDTLPYYHLEVADKNFMYVYFKDAVDFIEKHDMPLYCGEYGVYETADDASAERWLDDTTSIMCELGIGHAVWSYRGFSRITEPQDNTVVSEKMVEYIARK